MQIRMGFIPASNEPSAHSPILSMAWLLSNIIERCKCLFMGISSVFSFYPAPPKTVKSRKNGVKNGVCLWDVCQKFSKNKFAGF